MKFEYAMFEFRGENRPQLLALPQSDGSGEGFALEQVLRIAQPDQAYFWATHQGAELDLLMFKNGQRVGVAFKRADAPPHDVMETVRDPLI